VSISVGSPLVNYKLVTQSRDRLLAQFQKTPTYAKAVAYYRENIGKVASVDDLLKDRRLLQVALSAFQLEDEINSKGLIKKLLTEDPSDKKSVAYRLVDPRFRQFAAAFAALKSDGGKQLRSAAMMGSILGRFETNEFEKFIGESDPAVREALYYKRTVKDTIDVSNVAGLLDKFKKSAPVAAAVKYYRDNIGTVTNVHGLLNDDRLLSFALSAYGLDALMVDKRTVERLLTEDPAAKNSLANIDSRFAGFATAFKSLRYDGGASLHNTGNIDALVAAFESREFEQSVSGNDAAARTSFNAQHAAEKAPAPPSTSYYRDKIATVAGVSDLMADDRLLGVALLAFDLGPLAEDEASVLRLLSEDPAASESLAQSDPRMMQFATHFASLKSDGGAQIRAAADIDAVAAAFAQRQYGSALDVVQAAAYYRDNIADVVAPAGLLDDGELRYIALAAYGIADLFNDTASVQRLLTEDPTAPGSLAQTDPRTLPFAEAFRNLQTDGGAEVKSAAHIDAVLAAFEAKGLQSTPTMAQSTQYYRDNIAKVSDVDELLGDGQLLHVVLSAYGIGDLVNDKASVRRLLTEFTFLPNALARTDPRFMRFAEDFSSLQLDNGTKIKTQASIDAVVSAFQNPLVREGSGDPLLATYYRDSIGKITDVAGFVADKQLTRVALAAYGLSDLADDAATVQRLLTEDPAGPGALGKAEPRYAAFAAAFASLKSDGGAKLHDPADIDRILAAYETNEQARIFALVHPATRTGLYGKDGEKTLGGLLSEFQNGTGFKEAAAYFRANIGNAWSVDAFLKDTKLVSVALSAFRMEGLAEQPAVLRALLTQDPASPGAAAHADPRYMQFAQAFASLRSGTAMRDGKSIDAVLGAYQANEFEKSLDPKVKAAISSGGTLTPTMLIADRTMAKVTRGGLYLPEQTAALELEQQLAAMKRAGLDPAKLQDPAQLEKFVTRYLAKVGMEQAGAQPSLVSMLFQNDAGAADASGGGAGLVNLLA
jgi:hypothetical protein